MPAFKKSSSGVLGLCATIGSLAFSNTLAEQPRNVGLSPPALFTIVHGLNVPGPFEHSHSVNGAPNGQVSEFDGLVRSPLVYSPAELRQQGFDFVRVPVNPAVLLENPGPVRQKMISEVISAAQPYFDQRMRVIFDLHFWKPSKPPWTAEALLSSNNKELLDNYGDLVVEVAKQIARLPQGLIALEILNEPPKPICKDDDWWREQKSLVALARGIAPTLPIIVKACQDDIDDLLRVNPSAEIISDPNILFSIHFYEPMLFTHQGAGQRTFVVGIPYPSTGANEQELDALADSAVGNMPVNQADKAARLATAHKDIHDYIAKGANRHLIESRLGQVSKWAEGHNIASNRLLVGEFGAINWVPSDSATRAQARQQWDADVRAVADSKHFAWAFWCIPNTRGPIYR